MQQIDQKQMLPVGTMLDNRYKIVSYLASGGFGNTYEAEDCRSEKSDKVAVKEFFMRGVNHRSEDRTTVVVSNENNKELFDTQLQKFKREADRISSFQCDHIIHVSDLFDTNGTSYYVMELLQGTSLDAQVRQQPLSEEEARDVVYQVLEALKVIHANGLYHLDIKPGNIIRDKNGHCTLIDFGASKQLSPDGGNSFVSSAMAYTPGFAPIEQITQQTKHIGPWTDFFALGATLYNLLTGKIPPRVDEDDSELGSSRYPFPPTVSENTCRAIMVMMKYSRKHRPQNVDEVEALLDGRMTASVNDFSENATQIDRIASETDETFEEDYEEKRNTRKKLFAILGLLVIANCGLLLWIWSNGGFTGKNAEEEQESNENITDEQSIPKQQEKQYVISISEDGFVNIRQEPSAQSSIIGRLNTNGTPCELIENSDDWCKIREDSIEGYVKKAYVFIGTKQEIDDYREKVEKEKNELRQQTYNAYMNKLDEYAKRVKNEDRYEANYFLHDITGDGVPELFIYASENRKNDYLYKILYIYSYNQEKMEYLDKIEENWGIVEESHFFGGKGYLINIRFHEAAIFKYRITYKNGEININEEDIDYNNIYPKIPKITFYKVNNRSPLNQLLK